MSSKFVQHGLSKNQILSSPMVLSPTVITEKLSYLSYQYVNDVAIPSIDNTKQLIGAFANTTNIVVNLTSVGFSQPVLKYVTHIGITPRIVTVHSVEGDFDNITMEAGDASIFLFIDGLWTAVNTSGGGGGGSGGFFSAPSFYAPTYVDPHHPDAADDNDLGTPFLTLSGMITGYTNNNVWGSVAGCYARPVCYVSSGMYDEDITIPADAFLEIVGMGPVTLGDGAGLYFTSTTPRSITWINNQETEDVGSHAPGGNNRRPHLIIGTLTSFMGEGISTHTQYATGFTISGDLLFQGGIFPSTTCELHLNGVRLCGMIDVTPVTPGAGIRNGYFQNCRFDSNLLYSGLNLVQSFQCKYDGDVSAGNYSRIVRSYFGGNVTFTGG